MRFPATCALLFLTAALPLGIVSAQDDGVRTIHLKQDNAQVKFVSRLYKLEHVKATDILPYVNSAVLRYSVNSTVRRVQYSPDSNGKDALLVSTGEKFMPYVADLISKIDRPGKPDTFGSVIEGTGVSRIAYSPRYRAATDLENVLNSQISSSEGRVYVNPETNTVFWRDEHFNSLKTLSWLEKLDRPLPQARVRISYYEVRDSTLRDIGFDYLAWKNGPGVNLLNLGYSGGRLAVDEIFQSITTQAISNFPTIADMSMNWGLGGFYTAPQFDMSFIRILQQSGNANVVADATLTMVNSPFESLAAYRSQLNSQKSSPDSASYQYKVSMYPEYQNISKNSEGRSFIGASYIEEESVKKKDPPVLDVTISSPVICFPSGSGRVDALKNIPGAKTFYKENALPPAGGVIFQYNFKFKNVVERGNLGSELSNETILKGAQTLGFGAEKVLAVYEKTDEVTQTIGLPVFCRIPLLKYLFSTTTKIREHTYIVISAEVEMVDPEEKPRTEPPKSTSSGVKERI